MKKGFILIAATLVAASAMAGPQKHATMAMAKGVVAPKTISCAVMKGHQVNIVDATKKHNYTDYKGKRYFFCCGGCAPAFKKNPDKYASAPSIPTPKAAKKA